MEIEEGGGPAFIAEAGDGTEAGALGPPRVEGGEALDKGTAEGLEPKGTAGAGAVKEEGALGTPAGDMAGFGGAILERIGDAEEGFGAAIKLVFDLMSSGVD